MIVSYDFISTKSKIISQRGVATLALLKIIRKSILALLTFLYVIKDVYACLIRQICAMGELRNDVLRDLPSESRFE